MSIILGLKTKEEILIITDSIAIDSEGRFEAILDKKVFEKNNFIFSFVGSFKIGQYLKYRFEIPKKPSQMPWMNYFVNIFAPKFLEEISDLFEDEDYDVNILIGCEGGLFQLSDEVIYEVNEFIAIGQPQGDFAFGAYEAIKNQRFFLNLSNEDKLIYIMEVVNNLSKVICKPWIIKKMVYKT